jgi:long-chain fatty acid transport protein
MTRQLFTGVAVTALLATWANPARGNPADAFGFGGRGPSMGNAHTAAAEDGSANYYNPALIATFDDIHIDLGYQYARPSLLVNDLDLHVNSSRGLAAALSVPGKVGSKRVAFGGGLFLPDERISRVRTPAAEQPRFQYYDNRPQRLVLAANLGVEITDRLFVGAGISYMSSTQGDVFLEGRVGFPNAEDSDMVMAIDVDLRTIRYAQAGLLFRATPWLDLGFSYRGGFVLVLDQGFVIEGDVGSAGEPPVVEDGYFMLQTISEDLFQPAQYTAGLSARLTPRMLLAFDLSYHRWSAFENPSANITLDMDIGDFNDLVDIPEAPPLPDPNFHDVLVPRLGWEWLVSTSARRDYLLRAGYSYEASPVPEQVGESNFIDNDKHTVSVGAGLILREFSKIVRLPAAFDGYLALTILPDRRHRKLSPVNSIGDYRAGGRVLQAGLLTRWRF